MLIDSPRLTQADRNHWNDLTRYDATLAQDPRWPLREKRAHQTIHDFATKGPCYVSTSWGKDSVVVAHLAATTGLHLPLIWVRVDPWENPDCLTVRDTFLTHYGHLVDYHEITIPGDEAARWWDDDITGKTRHAPDPGFKAAAQHFGNRHITGVRGEESRIRSLVMSRWGEAGPNTCRPIGYWTATDVFAYLHRHNLPIHPAYAMSAGGQYDRRWLRVSTIGGIRGADQSRADWETLYYNDVITTGRKTTP